MEYVGRTSKEIRRVSADELHPNLLGDMELYECDSLDFAQLRVNNSLLLLEQEHLFYLRVTKISESGNPWTIMREIKEPRDIKSLDGIIQQDIADIAVVLGACRGIDQQHEAATGIQPGRIETGMGVWYLQPEAIDEEFHEILMAHEASTGSITRMAMIN